MNPVSHLYAQLAEEGGNGLDKSIVRRKTTEEILVSTTPTRCDGSVDGALPDVTENNGSCELLLPSTKVSSLSRKHALIDST